MKKGTKNALIGFFAGAAAGALTGILLAPEKGSVTREKISKKAKDASKDVTVTFNEKVEELKEQVNKLIIEMLEKVKEAGEKVTETGGKVTETGEKVKETGEKVKEKADEKISNKSKKATS
jgi:gas vesicle protein